MATFNRAHLIEESLKSVIDQSFKNWECLVIDDGSTDGTGELIKSIELIDERIRYFKRPENYKKGLPGCRNYGLDIAKGDYVIYFDDDDIAHPDNLKICVAELEDNNVSYCRYLRGVFREDFDVVFDRGLNYSKKILNIRDLEEIVMGTLPFNSCQVMWRRECFNNNYFNEELMYAEEWECYLRILLKKVKGVSVNKVLFYGRKHLNSNTGEFYTNDPVRRRSYSKAVKLVIENLKKNDLLSAKLKQYFIRMGFFFKDYSIIQYTLETVDSSTLEKSKYRLGFVLYPLLKRYFNFVHDLKKRTKK
ncbi:glycosyltransferase family 2 protein [Salinimicrobium tongyeongense]|uniref:Glycosyltransferase family 2 protein n=2 Tax=Salinimicrobium tongyeongense TaxID=2809707 RepID=A0ABY6NV08_9FLAO|nr:glycosyltransferase family 2 protein [Salinimicrobium tongyeongense]